MKRQKSALDNLLIDCIMMVGDLDTNGNIKFYDKPKIKRKAKKNGKDKKR